MKAETLFLMLCSNKQDAILAMGLAEYLVISEQIELNGMLRINYMGHPLYIESYGDKHIWKLNDNESNIIYRFELYNGWKQYTTC